MKFFPDEPNGRFEIHKEELCFRSVVNSSKSFKFGVDRVLCQPFEKFTHSSTETAIKHVF